MKTKPAFHIITTFAILIATGTAGIYIIGFNESLPGSRFVSSIFTATSAVCVTGLTVVDLSNQMTMAGQLIVLILIQLGGVGLLTLSNWVMLALRGRMKLYETVITVETFGFVPHLSPADLLKRVIIFTTISETAGFLLLLAGFSRYYPVEKAGYLAIFHSISAFCNAGFSLFPESLVRFSSDPVINLTVIFLIVTGGIGFLAASDIIEWLRASIKRKRRKLSFHTKVVIATSATLITGAFVIFFIVEFNNSEFSQSLSHRLFKTLFLSVTPRTAGFNTCQIPRLQTISILLLIFLMIIGASPGSTGAGIKTTTFSIIWASLKSQLKQRKRTELFTRSISQKIVRKSYATVMLYSVIVLYGIIGLEITESPSNSLIHTRSLFLDRLFEVISATSTVGLSLGITSKLSNAGLMVLIPCMFAGRIGPLLIVSSFFHEEKAEGYYYPEADIMVG